MIQYKCPQCGANVDVFILTSIPAITLYKCTSEDCSYRHEEKGSIVEVTAPSDSDPTTLIHKGNGDTTVLS